MTRAGRILGAMVAMGAGLGDYGGGNLNRERYEDWLDHVWGVPKRGSSQQRQPVMRAAEAKRARKAAKRRRDAELSRLGAAAERRDIETASLIRLGHWRDVGDLMSEMRTARRRMHAIRRGEVAS